jgi:hypothetical protein
VLVCRVVVTKFPKLGVNNRNLSLSLQAESLRSRSFLQILQRICSLALPASGGLLATPGLCCLTPVSAFIFTRSAPWVCLHTNFIFHKDTGYIGLGAHPTPEWLILTHLQQPCFQIWSHSEVLGVTPEWIWGRHSSTHKRTQGDSHTAPVQLRSALTWHLCAAWACPQWDGDRDTDLFLQDSSPMWGPGFNPQFQNTNKYFFLFLLGFSSTCL